MTRKYAVKCLAALMLFCSICFALPANAMADPSLRPVQAFDVKEGKVVKSVENNDTFQTMAKEWLQSVSGLAPQVQLNDQCGYVFRIPLAASAQVQAGDKKIAVQDVFMFYCPNKLQLLLVFDEARKPYLLQFTADIQPFLKIMDL